MTLAFILFILLWGLVVGGLARLAVPGPDPMPIWLTIAIGIGGSLIGGIVTIHPIGSRPGWSRRPRAPTSAPTRMSHIQCMAEVVPALPGPKPRPAEARARPDR